ncbi:MAG: hypothetical protein R3E39_29500 [Anaerolineae bacterium]
MKRTRITLLIVTLVVLLAGMSISTTGAQDAAPQPDGVNLTIYNQGTALVQDRRTFDLAAGVSTLDFTDVAASIDSTSVSFTSLTDPLGTRVLEQNYVFDLVGSSALFERYIDEPIEVVTNDGTAFAGQLLSGRNGEIILRQDSGEVTVLSQSNLRDVRFPA